MNGRGRRPKAKYACEGKMKLTRDQTFGYAKKRSKETGGRFNAYRCPYCYLEDGRVAWHFGHKKANPRY